MLVAMDKVCMDKSVALELVDARLTMIQDQITIFLNKWDYTSPNKFLHDARRIRLEDAKKDARIVKTMMETREKFLNLKKEWEMEEINHAKIPLW